MDTRSRGQTLTPQRWQRLQELFERALPLDMESRLRLLSEECTGDPALKEQVLALLLASAADSGTLEMRVESAIAGAMQTPELPEGKLIGRYRIVRRIGHGGMGAVYLAERADEQYHQLVALKVVARGLIHEGVASRFRAERQILARLAHPNIARLLDGGTTEDGAPFLVMEHIEGVRIDEYCATHGLSTVARLRLVQQVCAAVQYAHQNLVIHRDLKPSNILVTVDGVPKLLDFGIAKLLDPSFGGATSPLTRMHDRMLTPEHASPEQFRGEPVGTVSDVYSLGVLLYQLLTGSLPFDLSHRPVAEIERIVCSTAPPAPSARAASFGRTDISPRALSRELAGDLDNIVLKAMHRDPQRRYASAAALSQDIQDFLEGRPVQARPDTWAYRTAKFLRRNALAASASAVTVVTIAALVAFYTARLTSERNAAERERETAATVSSFMVDVFRLANPNESDGDTVTVREVLDAAAKRIETELADRPRLRLTLMRYMSQSYSGIGLWSQANEMLTHAIEQERALFGPDGIELANSLVTLGHVQHNMGRFDDAQRSFEEALAIRARLKLPPGKDGILLLSSIGSNLRAQQRFEEALARLSEAESLARKLKPAQPDLLGQVLQSVAMAHLVAGDNVNAERYAREALPLVKDLVYEGQDLYANVLSILANTATRLFRLDEAETLHRRFVERQTERLGRDHPLVGRAWNNFAHVLRAKGDYEAGAQALQEALRIFRLPGSPEPDIATGLHNLGTLLREAGQPARALEELNLALAEKLKTGGPGSPQLVTSLIEKAGALRELGRLRAADATLDEAEVIAAERFDPSDRRRAWLLAERGRLTLAAGDPAGAESQLREAVRQLREQDNPARLADALASFGEALLRTGQFQEGRSAIEEALATREIILPAGHWAIAEVQSRLGEALAAEGEIDRARELLAGALESLRSQRPAGDLALSEAERRWRELAEVTGQGS